MCRRGLVLVAFPILAVLVALAWWLATRPASRRPPPLPPDTGMAQVRASGVLRVAMDASYPPFAVAVPDGSLHGLDVDLAEAIARQLDVKAQLLNISEDSLPDALFAGQADIIISEMHPDRRLHLAFSQPYYNAGQVLLVAANERGVTGPADLRGNEIGVELGSDADEWLRRQPRLGVQVRRYDAVANAITDLQAGRIAGVITDAPDAADFIRHGAAVRIAGPPLTQEPYVIAAAPQNLSLVRAMNAALTTLQTSGALPALVGRDV